MPRSSNQESIFRAAVGVGAIIAGMAALIGLFLIEIPEGNREPLLLAIGIVLGWGSAVVQSEFGSTMTGRRLADAATDALTHPEEQERRDRI